MQTASELEQIIANEDLRSTQTRAFIGAAFRDGQIRTGGTANAKAEPPVSRISTNGGHRIKRRRVVERLGAVLRADVCGALSQEQSASRSPEDCFVLPF